MHDENGKRCLWILLLGALVLTALVASATTLAPLSFQDLTRQATFIVRVRCVGTHSAWADGEIWTDTRFEILQIEKADVYGSDLLQNAVPSGTARSAMRDSGSALNATITLRQLGGSVDGIRANVEDVPQFRAGEEAYLFLWRRAGEPYRVLGWTQGTFRVATDATTGAARVTQDSAATSFRAETRQFQTHGVRNLPLSAFQERLRAALAANAR
jgi:hypothetical protein